MPVTISDVAERIARLTPGADGAATVAFTDDTQPTAGQVAAILRDAQIDLTARFGQLDPIVDAALIPAADNVAAWQAAFDVALSFYGQAGPLLSLLEARASLSLVSFIAAYERVHPEVVVPGGSGSGGAGKDQPPPATAVAYEPLPPIPWMW